MTKKEVSRRFFCLAASPAFHVGAGLGIAPRGTPLLFHGFGVIKHITKVQVLVIEKGDLVLRSCTQLPGERTFSPTTKDSS